MSDTSTQLPLPLLGGESVIGYYENESPNERKRVFVTNRGIVWHNEEWTRIDYSQMEDVTVDQEKTTVDRLLIQSAAGESTIPIEGGDGKLRDAWIVLHFLRQCRSDIDRFPA
jgi:hypothetical protein